MSGKKIVVSIFAVTLNTSAKQCADLSVFCQASSLMLSNAGVHTVTDLWKLLLFSTLPPSPLYQLLWDMITINKGSSVKI